MLMSSTTRCFEVDTVIVCAGQAMAGCSRARFSGRLSVG
jgi:hypothetical protein